MIRGGAHAFRNPPLYSPISHPMGPVAVDRAHPLADGLLMAFLPGTVQEELLTGARPTVSTVNIAGAGGGPALLNSGSQAGLRYAIQGRFHGLSRVSSFIWLSLTNTATPGSTQSVVRCDGTFTPCQWDTGFTSLRPALWAGGILVNNPGVNMMFGASAGQPAGFGCRWVSGATLDSWTRFQGLVAPGSARSGTIDAGSNPLCFTATEAGGENATQVNVFAFYAWNRYLSVQEFAHLDADPYAFLMRRG